MELLFVTSNKKKIQAAETAFKNTDIKINPVTMNLKEIQGDPIKVAVRKAKEAYQNLKKPLIINDSSFSIEALNKFPSVYANYVEKTLGDKFILKMLEKESNREAYYFDVLVYIDKYGYQVFPSKTLGKISYQSFEGDFYPYDKIFIKEGFTYPIAYYGEEEIDKLYQNKSYEALREFFQKRKVARGITFIDDKVLLLKRIRKEKDKYLSYYAIPGGGVEEGETIEEACLREVQEETCVYVKLEKFLDFEAYENGVCYYFFTSYQKGIPTLGGEEKERNNKDNFYQVELINIEDLDKINIYGIGSLMIKKAYQLKNKK